MFIMTLDLIRNHILLLQADIYVDPLDTDTIYLDFCGLWEAKRSDSYSRPTGKSPTGKG